MHLVEPPINQVPPVSSPAESPPPPVRTPAALNRDIVLEEGDLWG